MVVIPRVCSVCKVEFELHFRYQMEERSNQLPDGSREVRYDFYCSQRCLDQSHREHADGSARCNACSKAFTVELASQVFYSGKERHYACGAECRAKLLAGRRSVRLGELHAPSAAPQVIQEQAPPPLIAPPAAPAAAPLATAPLATPVAVPTLAKAEPEIISTIPLASNAEPKISSKNPRVLAIFNHKGGTGKTTTSIHVAAGLAARGHKVLLIDADGQGNVAASLNLKSERSLYHVLVMGLDFRQAVINARPNMDVILSNETLAAAELYLSNQRQRDRVFAQRLGKARYDYDYVVVDCSPSLSLLNQNALVMSDAVLCPVACDYLSLVGVRQVFRTIKQVNRVLGHPVSFWGILPTFFDTRAKICHEALDTLRQNFKEVCLEPIHFASRVKEAPSVGKTLFEFAPDSKATLDYARVVDRLISNPNAQPETYSQLGGVA